MTAIEIIESGVLELYVCGTLSTQEIEEVEYAIKTFPSVKKEVEQIENSLMQLSKKTAPTPSALVWSSIFSTIGSTKKIPQQYNWASLSGWAAAIICIGGIAWLLQQKNGLEDAIVTSNSEKTTLQEALDKTNNELTANNNVLAIIRSKAYNAITLPGNQAVSPEAYTKVYFNKKEQIAYIDTQGLPDAPAGKVYQVWSLQMDPLSPTSVGLINTTNKATKNLYKFEAIETSPQAFGVTLEPEGGSESPTLSQLYTLGMVSP